MRLFKGCSDKINHYTCLLTLNYVEGDDKLSVVDMREVKVLKAGIQKYAAGAARLSREIAEHEADIAVWTGDM